MVLMFYWPLASVLSLGFDTSFVPNDPTQLNVWPILWFTVWQAVLSTIICLLLGIPGAYVLYRKSFRGAAFVRSLITVPFMLPSLVVAIAITELGAIFGGFNPVFAIILANVFANFAVVVRTVGSQWQGLDPLTEDEAAVAGAGRFATAMRITLPQLRSSIRSSSAIVILYCASSYGIVLSLGGGKINTLETAISISVLQKLDLQQGAALALLQIAFCLLAFTVSRWGGTNPLSFEPQGLGKEKLDRRDFWASAISFLTVAVLVVIPLVLVTSKAFISPSGSLTFDNFALLDTRGARDLLNITFFEAGLNSLRNLAVATVIAVIIGALVSYLLAEHTRRRSKREKKTDFVGISLDFAFLLPIGVSAVVVGLGYLICFSGPFVGLRSSWVIVPLAQAVLAIPMVIRVLYPGLVAIEASAREQAMTDGAKTSQLFYHIDLALIRPSLKTAIAFSALVSLGEFGAASLLAFGDQSTVPMLMYQLISRPGAHNYGMALAVASILCVLTTVVVFLVGREGSTRKRPVLH